MRYVSVSEAAWRLLSFPMVEHHPPVERLEVHLEDHHTIYFEAGNEHQAALKGEEKPKKLMGWFKANTNFPSPRHIRYTNFPTFFRWNKTDRKWDPRAKYRIKKSHPTRYDFTLHDVQHVVGRMYNISPKEGERYFLRTLQLHKAGMDYFKSLRIVDRVLYSTYREACCALGLLANDAEWMRCQQESYHRVLKH